MKKELKILNFNKVLKLNTDAENYDYNAFRANGCSHPVKGFCTLCEEKGINISSCKPDYKLWFMSHGASSSE